MLKTRDLINRLLHTGFCTIILLFSGLVVAQPVIEVIDFDSKEPLPGAHVHWLNDNHDVMKTFVTNQHGKVALDEWKVQNAQTFSVRFIGYDVQQIEISPQEINVQVLLKSKSLQLEEAVVTGQYDQSDAADAVQPITVIRREKIEQMGAVTLNEVLSNELNIRLNQDNVLGTFMTMQGVSGQNVKILMDGVPVIGRLDGNIDLSQINLQNIERIEIIRGPMSVSYGTDALAGTINLITKNGKHYNKQIQVGSYLESSGKANFNGDFHWHNQHHIIQLSGGRNLFDGWNPYDGFFSDFSTPIADSTRFKQWKPRIQNFGDLSYTFRKNDIQLRVNSRVFDEVLISKGRPRAPYFETAFDEYYTTRRLDNNVTYNQRFKKYNNLQVIAAYNYFTRIRQTFFKDLTTLEETLSELEGSQDTSVFDLINIRSTWSQANPSKKLNYQLGLDINHETSVGRRILGQERSLGDYAFFASAEYAPHSTIKIRPALRFAYNTAFDSPLVPSLNLLWRFHEDWSFRSSYVRGFRAPTLKEMYFFFVDVNHNIVGNENLNAEFSHNIRSSISYRKGFKNSGLKTEMSFFYNDINNMITLAQIDATQFSYVNIGQFRTLGGALEASYLLPSWRFSSGVTFTGRDQGWEEFVFFPEVQLNISKTFSKMGLTLSGFYKYVGRLPGFALVGDEVINTFIDPYHLMDITASKSLFQKRLMLTLGCKNVLDVRQVNAFGGNGGAHSSGGNSVAIGMGRTLFFKLDWNIKYGNKSEKKGIDN